MTYLLAQIFGIYLLAVGIGVALNPERFRGWYRNLLDDDSQILMGGVIALLFGAFIVSVHNVWIADWPVLITILGWWVTIKGIGFMVFPGFAEFFRPMVNQSEQVYRISGTVWALIGAFLAYHGWM